MTNLIRITNKKILTIFSLVFIFTTIAMGETSELNGDAQRGKELFKAYQCYACHGYTGETGSGTRLNPPRFDQAGFITYVRNPSGRPVSFGPGGLMPAYASSEVTDQNLSDIYSFLKSIPSGSPPLEDIPLLNNN
jgi:mono/diheme cytochrome c family protein